MIKQISNFYLLQIWHQERQARKAHKEQLRILEEHFYTFLLEQPGVREAISKLDLDAKVSAVRNGIRFIFVDHEPPKSTRLLVEMNKKTNDSDANKYENKSVSYFLRNRAVNRRATLMVLLIFLAGLLLSFIVPASE